jgi:hypothetical protein
MVAVNQGQNTGLPLTSVSPFIQHVELRRELVGDGDEEGLREIAKIVAPPRRAERPLVSGSTNRQNRARRR